jgi:drug/metabolite transporter (DMT)-like permease
MGYVWTWYQALKVAPAALVTSVLTLGAIITIFLTTLLEGKGMTATQVAATLLMALGAAAFTTQLTWRMPQTAEAV